MTDGLLSVHTVHSSLRRDMSLPPLQAIDPGYPLAEPKPEVMVDLRTAHVRVGPADESEVIHAHKRDVPRILRLQAEVGGHTTTLTFMAENTRARTRWVERFRAAAAAAAQAGVPPSKSFAMTSHINSLQVPEVKDVNCAATVDENTLLLGASTGLYLVRERAGGAAVPLGDSKKMTHVTQVLTLPAFNCAAVVYGKTPQVRVFDLKAAVRRGDDGYKVPDSKNCSMVALGVQRDRALLVVLIRKTVLLCDINGMGQVQPARTLDLDAAASFVSLAADGLVVGMGHSFTLFDTARLRAQALISSHDAALDFARVPLAAEYDLRPRAAFEVSRSAEGVVEFLLCFQRVAFFVNQAGMSSRDNPLLKWRCDARHFQILREFNALAVVSASYIELISLDDAELLQVVALPSVAAASDVEPLFITQSPGGVKSVIQLWSAHATPPAALDATLTAAAAGPKDAAAEEEEEEDLVGPLEDSAASKRGSEDSRNGAESTRGSSGSISAGPTRRRFTFGSRRGSKQSVGRGAVSRAISGPKDFQHVEHMGSDSRLRAAGDEPPDLSRGSSLTALPGVSGAGASILAGERAGRGSAGNMAAHHISSIRPRVATVGAISSAASSSRPSVDPGYDNISTGGRTNASASSLEEAPSGSSLAPGEASPSVLRSNSARVRANRMSEKVESLGFAAMLADPNKRFSDLYHMIAGEGASDSEEDEADGDYISVVAGQAEDRDDEDKGAGGGSGGSQRRPLPRSYVSSAHVSEEL